MRPNPSPNERPLGVSPGDIIGGRYEVVRLLGVGGTGAVFEARHRTIQRTVAVKLLLPEIATSNPAVPQRFLQEARTSNEVRHKNIVEVIDFGNDDGRLFMVMEFLEGESLGALLKREAPVAPGTIIRLLEPIMSALALAHGRGIVHRDVKPQNIFLSRTPGDDQVIPKLIDFGIAKRIVTDDVTLTATGMILGTPAYMPPEQATGGSKNVTPAADQYALGAIMYEALTGTVPHYADAYPAMLVAIVSGPPTDIRLLRPDLDPALAAVVTRALAYEPSHRYSSLYELRDALAPFRDLQVRGFAVRPGAPAPVAHQQTRPDGTPGATDARRAALARAPGALAPQAIQPTSPPPSLTATTATGGGALPWVAGVIGVIALGMVALAVGVGVSRRRPSAPPAAPAATTSTPRAATDGDNVTFRVDVDPPTATIAVDGVVVGQGHAEILRPRDGRRYQLRLSAPGHANVSDVLVAAADARISRVLAPLNAPAPPGPTTVIVRQPPPPAPTLVPALVPARPNDRRHPNIDRNNPFE